VCLRPKDEPSLTTGGHVATDEDVLQLWALPSPDAAQAEPELRFPDAEQAGSGLRPEDVVPVPPAARELRFQDEEQAESAPRLEDAVQVGALPAAHEPLPGDETRAEREPPPAWSTRQVDEPRSALAPCSRSCS